MCLDSAVVPGGGWTWCIFILGKKKKHIDHVCTETSDGDLRGLCSHQALNAEVGLSRTAVGQPLQMYDEPISHKVI